MLKLAHAAGSDSSLGSEVQQEATGKRFIEVAKRTPSLIWKHRAPMAHFLACFLVGGLTCKPSDLSAEPIEIFGISAAMPSPDIRTELSERDFLCREFEEIIDLSNREFTEFLLCWKEPSDHLLDEEQMYLDVAKAIESDLTSSGQAAGLAQIALHPKFSLILTYINSYADQAYRTTPAVLAYEYRGKRTILFSCATFSACERSSSEILRTLEASMDVAEQELILLTPEVPELLMPVGVEALEGASRPVDELQAALESRLLRFEVSTSVCLFGRDGDRACLYDAGFGFDVFAMPALVESLFVRSDVLRALGEFRVPTRMIILEELNLNEPSLTFE